MESFGVSGVELSHKATAVKIVTVLCIMYQQRQFMQKFSESSNSTCCCMGRWNGIGGWTLPESHTDFVYAISRPGLATS